MDPILFNGGDVTIFKNALFFCLPLFLAPLLEGAYKVFFMKIVDTKFGDNLWMAYQAWIGMGLILAVFIGVAFIILSFFSKKFMHLNISRKQAIIMGFAICLLTYVYGFAKKAFSTELYDPVDVGNVLLALAFVGLNITAKNKKQEKPQLSKTGDNRITLDGN